MGLKQFIYTGRTRDGATQRGELVAWDREQALRNLQYDGINVISLQESEKPAPESDSSLRLSGERLALLYRELSTLYNAGVSLDRSFRLLAGMEMYAPPKLVAPDRDGGLQRRGKPKKRSRSEFTAEARVCHGIANALAQGFTLAQAMSLYPNVFGPPHIAMVEVGGRGGILPRILEHLALLTERADALQKKVRSSTTYPIFVLLASIATVFGLFNFIMPQFLDLVREMNVKLPFFTWGLIYLAKFMRHPATLATAVVMFVLWPRIWKALQTRQQVKHLLDSGSLTSIVFGQVTHKVALARGMQILAALTSAGINLTDALPLAARACGNRLVSDGLAYVSEEVVNGVQMSTAMRQFPEAFPRALIAYVETGELSGQLPEMLVRAADIVSMDAHRALEVLPELLEPLIIFIMGIMVGAIVLSVFVPLYDALRNL